MAYDLIIIGGGPAGYQGAETAARRGLKVLLFEEHALGGTCLNVGCIPSKAILHSAKVYEYAKNASRYGVSVTDTSLDHKAVIQRKDRIVRALTQGVSDGLKKAGVEIIHQRASILKKSADSFLVEAGGVQYEAKYLLICTGSVPAYPPIEGISDAILSGFAVTTSEMLSLGEVPKELVVIGGGIAGLELAQYYALSGSKVTVLEMLAQIGGSMDKEMASTLKRELEQRGITFHLEAKVTSIQDNKINYSQDGEIHQLEANKILVSTGRKPNIKNIGLENLGLDLSKGLIETDEHMRTKVQGVFAAGDVNGKSMLAHTAYKEADVAVSNILGKDAVMQYTAVPSVIYTNPEAAWVGQDYESLVQEDTAFKEVRLPMMKSGRYAAEGNSPRGFIKVYVDAVSGCILSVHAIGNGSSEFIFGAAMAIENKLNIKDASKTIFPHPTVGEVLLESFKAFDME